MKIDTTKLSYHDKVKNESLTFLIDEGQYQGYLLELHYGISWTDGSPYAEPDQMYLIDLHDDSRNVTKDPYFQTDKLWDMCTEYIDEDKAFWDNHCSPIEWSNND